MLWHARFAPHANLNLLTTKYGTFIAKTILDLVMHQLIQHAAGVNDSGQEHSGTCEV